MQEFRRVRGAIDALIDETKESIKMKFRSESLGQLEQARGLIRELKQLSTIDQAAIVAKRETTVASLTDIADKLQKPALKKRSPKETAVQAATL